MPRSPRIVVRPRTSPSTTSKLGRRSNRWCSRRAKSGSRSRTTTRQSGRAFSASTRVIGPVPAPSSTSTRALSQGTLRTVVRDSQRLLGARLAMAVPCRKNLPRNREKSLIRCPDGGGATRPSPAWPSRQSTALLRHAEPVPLLLFAEEPDRVERGGDVLELVAEEPEHELVDQP